MSSPEPEIDYIRSDYKIRESNMSGSIKSVSIKSNISSSVRSEEFDDQEIEYAISENDIKSMRGEFKSSSELSCGTENESHNNNDELEYKISENTFSSLSVRESNIGILKNADVSNNNSQTNLDTRNNDPNKPKNYPREIKIKKVKICSII